MRRGGCRILDRRGRKFLSIKKFGSGSALCGQASAPIDLATPSGRHRYRSWLGWEGRQRGGGVKGSGREDLVDGGGCGPVQSTSWRSGVWTSNATSKDSEVLYGGRSSSSSLLPTCLTCGSLEGHFNTTRSGRAETTDTPTTRRIAVPAPGAAS